MPVSSQALNRVYLNADVGIPKHYDVGLVLHVFKYFSVAGYSGTTRVKAGVGPTTVYPITKTVRQRNRYDSKYLLVGVTTQTFRIINCSFMLGPSWTHGKEVTITNYYNSFSQTEDQIYDKVYPRGLGCAFRADAILEVTNFFGVNAGIQYNLNPVRSEWTIQLGLNLGLIKDKSDPGWKHRMGDRVIIDRDGSYR